MDKIRLRARELRKHQTFAEKLLWHLLRKKSLGCKFRRQHCIGNYVVDFYCSEFGLVIEVDGDVHDLDDVKEYDSIRQKYLETSGYKVIRFQNEEVINETDRTLKAIEEVVYKIKQTPPKPSPQ